jgi:hypothetical protein
MDEEKKDYGMLQVSIFDPNVEVHVHEGAHWDVVLKFGDEYIPHTTWYLKGDEFDRLINNLLKAQLSLAIRDADKRKEA